MSDNSDDLIISISTDLAAVRRGLARMEQDTAKSSKALQRQFDQAGKNIDASLTRSFKRAETAMAGLGRAGAEANAKFIRLFAVAGSTRGAQTMIDAATRIQNSLKIAGVEGENLTNVYDSLYQSAQRNGAPIEALSTLYGRAAMASKELGASQKDLLKFTDGVSLALRVGQTDATQAAGALLQLSQALGSSKVMAEEYNSINEGARPILQAVAAGLEEAGGSVSKLTQLVKSGEVSNKAFFNAFIAGMPVLEKAVAGAENTISSRFVRLQNVLIDAAGRFNQSAEAGKVFGGAIDELANEIGSIDFGKVASQIQAIADALNSGTAGLRSWAEYIGKISGLDNIGHSLVGPDGISLLGGALQIKSTDTPEKKAAEIAERRLKIEKEIAEIKSNPANVAAPFELRVLEGKLAALPAPPSGPSNILGTPDKPFRQPAFPHTPTPPKPVKPVTLKDYPVEGGDDKETKKAESAALKAANAYRDLKKNADDRIGQVQQEIALLGKFGVEADAARFALDLFQQSEDKGRSLSAEQRAELEKKIGLYREFSDTLSKAKLQQDLLNERRFNSLSKEDQHVITTQRQYGRPESLDNDDARMIRESLGIEDARDQMRSFFGDFKDGVLNGGGDIGKSLADAIQRPILGPEIILQLEWSFT